MNNNKYKILLVEDETNILSFITTLLEVNDYQVICAKTCNMAISLFSSFVPDLVILDLGLPDQDGKVLLEKIRQTDTTPVIILSARTAEADKVTLLDMGANDYITKPFGSEELLARIRSCLRHNRHCCDAGHLPGGKFENGSLVINYDSRQVFIDGTEVKLTQTEYNILSLLSANCGKVMTYAAIIKSIWRETPDERSIKKLQVNMANIRKKFRVQPGEVGYVVNELGVGYRMG